MVRASTIEKLYSLSKDFKVSKTREVFKTLESLQRRIKRKPLTQSEARKVKEALRMARINLLAKGKENEFLRVSEFAKKFSGF